MIIRTTLAVWFLSCWIPVAAQKNYWLRTITDSLEFQVTTVNRQLSLNWQAPPAIFNAKAGDFPIVTAIVLLESDLVLTYLPGNTKNGRSYEINLGLRAPGGDSIAPKPYEWPETRPAVPGQESLQMVWLDFAEHLSEFGSNFTLYVARTLLVTVNCAAPRPAFNLPKQLPHFAAGAAGAALIGLGQVYNQQKKEAYRQYRNSWAAGDSREAAENPFFQTAAEKRKAARVCTYTGWALLGADALWYALRWIRFRQRQREYDRFCGKPAFSTLQLHPAVLPQSPFPGIGISFTFSNARP